MAENTSPTVQQQLDKLRSRLDVADRHILHMQKVGGFTDSKTHGVRTTRIEDRVAVLERDIKLLLDLAGLQASFIEEHLATQHAYQLVTSNEASVIWFRKIKRALREWTEACKLTRRGRSDIAEARRDENRLRPREAASS
jgi:hypothetical protein